METTTIWITWRKKGATVAWNSWRVFDGTLDAHEMDALLARNILITSDSEVMLMADLTSRGKPAWPAVVLIMAHDSPARRKVESTDSIRRFCVPM